jgi:hypothetical protein
LHILFKNILDENFNDEVLGSNHKIPFDKLDVFKFKQDTSPKNKPNHSILNLNKPGISNANLSEFQSIGDWGLGIGDWGLGPIPNPQSPIPNPQSPFVKF